MLYEILTRYLEDIETVKGSLSCDFSLYRLFKALKGSFWRDYEKVWNRGQVPDIKSITVYL